MENRSWIRKEYFAQITATLGPDRSPAGTPGTEQRRVTNGSYQVKETSATKVDIVNILKGVFGGEIEANAPTRKFTKPVIYPGGARITFGIWIASVGDKSINSRESQNLVEPVEEEVNFSRMVEVELFF